MNSTYPEQTNLGEYLWKERQKTLEHCQRKILFKKMLMEADASIKSNYPNVSIFAQL